MLKSAVHFVKYCFFLISERRFWQVDCCVKIVKEKLKIIKKEENASEVHQLGVQLDAAMPVAITGLSFRLPGDLGEEDEFWRALIERRDLVTKIPEDRWATAELQHDKRSEPGRSITFSAGVLSRIDEFDAGFFGISPREAALLDPQQRLLLELSWEAMENAGVPPSSLAGTNCAVYVGVSGFDYGMRGADDLSVLTSHSMTGNTLSIAANRLSYVFNLHGPSLAVDTACSSSLVALHHACNSLRNGEASSALVGGVNLLLHPQPFIGFTKASMLSADGRCKSFDAAGDGYVRAEGGVVLLLKPLDNALASGDQIHGVILASGVNADGARKTGITIPSSEGQAELMRKVLARSGLAAGDIDFVEAHGTGTSVGDPIETAAIGAVYGQGRAKPLPIGSVKANLGHLEPASGLAGLVKTVVALKNRALPPSLHLHTPNPRIDFKKLNLELVTDYKPLTKENGKPLIAGVNSFGFGGANAHVLLQEFVPTVDESRDVAKDTSLPPLVLSARTDAALRAMARRYAELLSGKSVEDYYDIAYASVFRRECMEKRFACMPDSVDAAVKLLQCYAAGESPAGITVEDALPSEGDVAFVYSGNGAQWVGMGQVLMLESPRFAELLAKVDQVMQPLAGFSVITEIQADHAASRIADTTVAQPLLFAIQVAVTTLLKEVGIVPAATTGHSVGEIAAAWAAGALNLEQAVRVIVARSQAQGLTRGTGRMAAVGMSAEAVSQLIAELGNASGLEIAGINSPGNVTLSGSLEALHKIQNMVEMRGGFFRLLDLDYAFHSRQMEPARADLAQRLEGFKPVGQEKAVFVSTVTGDILYGTQLDAEYWWRNVREPVRFADAVRRLAKLGCRVFVEISPHAILQRYISECLTAAATKGRVIPTLRRNDDGQERLTEAALRIQLLAEQPAWQSYFPQLGRQVRLPNYPWQRERHWLPQTTEALLSFEQRHVHPLLGWRVRGTEAAWENVLDPISQPWLADHRVGGAVVYPGAAYIEMALAAAREYFGGETQELEEFDIVAPVVFDGEHGRSIRLDLNPRDGSFQIRSRQRLSDDEWALNASGRLLGSVSGYVAKDTSGPAGEAVIIARETHYQLAGMLGLDYGPVFQGMSSARLSEAVLEGQLEATVDLGLERDRWLLHPAIVDVCFQSLLDFFQSEIEAGVGLPLLPVKVGRLRLLEFQPVVAFQTHILRRGLRSVLAEFVLFAADGKPVAVFEKCRFRSAALRQGKQKTPECWEIKPQLQPGVLASNQSASLRAPHNLAQQIKEWFADQEGQLKRNAYFAEAQPLLDALVSAFVCEAMQYLIATKPVDASAWLDANITVSLEHARLLGWARDLLIEQACLTRNDDGWRMLETDMPPAAEIWRTILAEYPSAMPELVLIGRIGRALGQVLAGDCDPSTIVSEVQCSHQLETLFDDSLTYTGIRLAIEQLIEVLAANLPANRRLRVLEIAPGLSEVPRHLGQRIERANVDYVLAHADPSACDHLCHEYRDDEWISVAELDNSLSGLKSTEPLPSHYDVLIFRHTLNDVPDRAAMLAWAKERLASGGLLVLAERYGDLATDLIWGTQRYLSPKAWMAGLETAGFDEIEICREPAADAIPVGPYLLLAKRPETTTTENQPDLARWLVLSGDAKSSNFGRSLREMLVSRGQAVVDLEIGPRLQCRESATKLLADGQEAFNGDFDHVVFIAAQRTHDDLTLPVEALSLVQALSGLNKPSTLVIVTRGGVPVDGLLEADSCNPAHAALWGFGRVVMNEFPALSCRLIDLPQGNKASSSTSLEALVDELIYPDTETEVVLSGNTRHALRMQKMVLARNTQHGHENHGFRLDFRVPGQLRNLLWLEHSTRALGPEEVEVRPLATGLNFRDVMYVMGLLPDEAVENGFAGASLGLEFSGVVTRVGHRVEEFAPGDTVMGFGSACFASHVVTRANALAVKPKSWSFEAAATVPTVFFTVYYALRHLANLQPGERVLIHGAAGGVGIAAIQLARHLGAEVFATAGSDEKREFVALLGADHVFDSRNLAYCDQILAATNGEGVDVILNSLAGEAIRRNLKVLRPFGRFLELGKRDFFENTPIGLRPFKDNISYFGIDADQLLIARPDLAGSLFREVMALFRSGVLTPLPVRVFPAERVIDAFRYMQQARQIGKVVVSFDGACITPQTPQLQESSFACQPDGAYLVTGGLSGFGLETACWLASLGAGQLLLLSRRGEATPGATQAVANLQALGTKVLVIACDVADRESLAKALQRRDLLPLKGIFHAAMVIDDALIANLDPERMARVLEPKVRGAWNLHELTRDLPLDHFMLYSSVTTYIGNPGQANYVAANAWMEGLAVLRRAQGLPVTCIGWGPIGDAGYLTRNQAVKDSLAGRLGADPLSAASALSMLGLALEASQSNLAIADFQFSALARLLPSAQSSRFTKLRRHADDVPNGTEGAGDFKSIIEGKSPVEVQVLVAQLVAQEVAQILAVSAERIDPNRSLHDLGLDSLMGVELALGLEKRFGIRIPAMVLNEGPTVERVTARIVERLASGDAPTEEGGGLAVSVRNMVAQHGESISGEVLQAVVADIENGKIG